MAEAAKKPKRFTPNWEAIMKVLGDPKQEAIYVNRNTDPGTMDGAWDFTAMQKGLGMRRVAADIGKSTSEIQTPSGFVFVCGNCGYARRVVDSEQSFSCERPNDSGPSGCGVIWEVQLEDADEINPNTGVAYRKPKLQERAAIGKMARKYLMPEIVGRYLGDMIRETAEARRAAGKPSGHDYQPQASAPIEPARRGPDPLVALITPEAPKPSVGGAK